MKSRKIAIIGVGLLGGSLALALKGKRGTRLAGWNHRASSRRKASKILPVASSLQDAVRDAQVVLLCSHSRNTGESLKEILPLLRPDALVLDVSSVKGEIVQKASRMPGAKKHFVPCHPMAGKEKSGVRYSDAGLYRGRVVFLTPLAGTPSSLVQKATDFWREVGAHPVRLDAARHDRWVALTSHLPHLLACALMELFGESKSQDPNMVRAVGSGFRDFTRIAAGNPAMWSDIMGMNAKEIRLALSRYRKGLALLEKRLGEGKSGPWLKFFEKARSLREKL